MRLTHILAFSALAALATTARADETEFKVINGSTSHPQLEAEINGQHFLFSLDVYPPRTHFYHWTHDEKLVKAWSLEGRVPEPEMKGRINHPPHAEVERPYDAAQGPRSRSATARG